MPARNQFILGAATALALAATPVTAFGQGTEEQQQACTPDAVKLCSDTIPDIPKTTACMKAHFSQLSPRCQTAFGEATGGAKTKAAERKPEIAPRARTATRAERRASERQTSERQTPERRTSARQMPERDYETSRGEREAALPQREAPEAAATPQVEGYPPFPSPDAPLARTHPASGIANACRIGLIDSFTCSTTVPALLGGPAY